MKTAINTVCALLFNIIVGAIIATLLGVSPLAGAIVMTVTGMAMSLALPPSAAVPGSLPCR